MKVLYITPAGAGGTSPQIEMANFMRKRFDKLDLFVLGKDPLPSVDGGWDVVFAAMEAAVPVAHEIAKQLEIPLYCHWEWLPPFRLYGYPGGDDPRNWGYRDEHVDEHYQNQGYYQKYKTIIECAIDSAVSSCAGNLCKDIAKEFSENSLDNCFLKYPASPIPLNKKRSNEKMDYFTTVSRLVPNKRVAHLAEAVKKANLDTTWVIVGEGPEKEIIQKIIAECRTKVKFIPNTNGEKKFFFLSKAKFQISAWHGLPQLEAALVGTPTINLHIPYIEELYGNSLTWAHGVDALAEKMKVFNEDQKLCSEQADRLYTEASEDKININTLEQGADIIEHTLRKIV